MVQIRMWLLPADHSWAKRIEWACLTSLRARNCKHCISILQAKISSFRFLIRSRWKGLFSEPIRLANSRWQFNICCCSGKVARMRLLASICSWADWRNVVCGFTISLLDSRSVLFHLNVVNSLKCLNPVSKGTRKTTACDGRKINLKMLGSLVWNYNIYGVILLKRRGSTTRLICYPALFKAVFLWIYKAGESMLRWVAACELGQLKWDEALDF